MIERLTPLGGGALGDVAGVRLAEAPFAPKYLLRGKAGSPGLPAEPNTVTRTAGGLVLWLAPDAWLAVGTQPDLEPDILAVDIGDARTAISVGGRHALDVLAKGCPLDLHPREFPPGRCAQTLMARGFPVLVHRTAADAFDLYVERPLAAALWDWLEDAAREYL